VPKHDGVHSSCLPPPRLLTVDDAPASTNNVVEYRVVIEIFHDVISHGIHSLEVSLDSI
jgi:hypothetical protein